ncbi:hypothetical protein HanRHA438_Chr10g0450121 [Helianthus annuus]|nr:hypothetical protein HanRHA438_Chr10g0450121 [Helianthus annuus]
MHSIQIAYFCIPSPLDLKIYIYDIYITPHNNNKTLPRFKCCNPWSLMPCPTDVGPHNVCQGSA